MGTEMRASGRGIDPVTAALPAATFEKPGPSNARVPHFWPVLPEVGFGLSLKFTFGNKACFF